MSVLEVEGPKGAVIVGEAGAGVGADVGVGVGVGVEVEASEGPRALVLWVPGKVIVGSLGFQ